MGRPKGARSKINQLAHEKAEEMGVDPFKVLLMFAKGDWKALGYATETYISKTGKDGDTLSYHVEPNTRAKCASDACRYLHPTQKAVEISGGQPIMKVIIEDYSKKS